MTGTALATATDVEQAYLAYFGRPADPEGLNYWIGQSIATMQAGFAASQEYANLYSGMTNDQRVEQVYQNLLGRASDPAGKAYWVGELDSGAVTVSNLVTSMLANAEGVDIATIANRTTFAIKLTTDMSSPGQIAGYSGTLSADAARAAVAAVSYTDTSLQTAESNIALDIQAIDLGETPDTLAPANASPSINYLALYGSINGVAQTSAANTYALTSGSNTVNIVVGSTAVTDTFDTSANPSSVTFNVSGTATGALTIAKSGTQTTNTSLVINDALATNLTIASMHGNHLSSATFNNTGTATLNDLGITQGAPLASVAMTGTGAESFSNITSGNAGFTLADSSSAAVTVTSLTAGYSAPSTYIAGNESISNSGAGLLTLTAANLYVGSSNTLTIENSNSGGITDTADTTGAGTVSLSNTGSGTITETAMTANYATSITATAGVTGTISDSSNTAVTVNASADNSSLTLNITGTGNNTITVGTGADSISAGVGSNNITVGTHAITTADAFTIAQQSTATATVASVPIVSITGGLAGNAAGSGDLFKVGTTNAVSVTAFTGISAINAGVAVPTTNTLAGFEAAAITDSTASGYVGYQDTSNFWIAAINATGGVNHTTFVELVGVTGVGAISTTGGANVVHIG